MQQAPERCSSKFSESYPFKEAEVAAKFLQVNLQKPPPQWQPPLGPRQSRPRGAAAHGPQRPAAWACTAAGAATCCLPQSCLLLSCSSSNVTSWLCSSSMRWIPLSPWVPKGEPLSSLLRGEVLVTLALPRPVAALAVGVGGLRARALPRWRRTFVSLRCAMSPRRVVSLLVAGPWWILAC